MAPYPQLAAHLSSTGFGGGGCIIRPSAFLSQSLRCHRGQAHTHQKASGQILTKTQDSSDHRQYPSLPRESWHQQVCNGPTYLGVLTHCTLESAWHSLRAVNSLLTQGSVRSLFLPLVGLEKHWELESVLRGLALSSLIYVLDNGK